MTAKELIAAVKQMRDAQKRYFRLRSPEVMLEAIRFETIVDKAIRDFEDGEQQQLFAQEDPGCR